MSLFDIKNKLYKKDAPEGLSKHAPSEYDPMSETANADRMKSNGEDLWAKKEGLGQTEKKAIKKGIIALAIILVIVLGFIAAYEIKKMSFNEARTVISISGPDQARSGKLITYEINCENANWSDINNSVFYLSYSEDFKPSDNPNFVYDSPTLAHLDLGTIKKGNTAKIVFNGKVYSPKGALMYFKADLKYQPKGFSSQFEAKDQMDVNIISTPIVFEIQAPQNISSGDEVNYLVNFRNDGAEPFENLKVKIDYPEKFDFSKSDPKVFEGNNIWYIGNLAAGQSGKIVVSGKLIGEREEIKLAKAYIGVEGEGEFLSYSEEETATKIVASPLFIAQTVNDKTDLKVNAGDFLRFNLTYKNNGDIGLRDVIIKEYLDSSVLDYSSLKTDGGSFDLNMKAITWKASDIKNLKNLEPGQEGKIIFSLKVKENIPITSANDKNFVISSVAKIDSPDIPTPVSMNKIISGNKMDIKLNSKMILGVTGFHADANISNSGPIPPKVGEETTYAMHWSVTNINNDVKDAKVEANLPTNAQMTGTIFPADAKITYNERSNSIIWEIGDISAGTGILNSPKSVSFQVKIKPSPDQVGREVDLLGESKLTARDIFTEENIEKSVDKKTTNLFEDKTVADGIRVVN